MTDQEFEDAFLRIMNLVRVSVASIFFGCVVAGSPGVAGVVWAPVLFIAWISASGGGHLPSEAPSIENV